MKKTMSQSPNNEYIIRGKKMVRKFIKKVLKDKKKKTSPKQVTPKKTPPKRRGRPPKSATQKPKAATGVAKKQ